MGGNELEITFRLQNVDKTKQALDPGSERANYFWAHFKIFHYLVAKTDVMWRGTLDWRKWSLRAPAFEVNNNFRCLIKFKTMLVRKSECSYRLRLQLDLDFSILPGLSWATLSDICHGNSMCCWSVTAIVKRINIFTRLLLQSQYKTLHLVNIRNVEKRFNSRSQPLSLSSSCWRLGTNCNLKGKLNYHQTMSIRSRETWFCNSTDGRYFHNFSTVFRLWSTTFNGLECHKKFLMTVWYDSIIMRVWQPGPRMWLHHYDSMTDPLHAKFRQSGKKTWPPRKIASQIWTPKNPHASLYSTFLVTAVHWFVTMLLKRYLAL